MPLVAGAHEDASYNACTCHHALFVFNETFRNDARRSGQSPVTDLSNRAPAKLCCDAGCGNVPQVRTHWQFGF